MHTEAQFKAGDRVISVLNRGPAMRVIRINKVGNVVCAWTDRKGSHEKPLKATTLKIYEPPKSRMTVAIL